MSLCCAYILPLLCRTPAIKPISGCGTSCTQSSPACLWRAQRRGSPVSWTPTTPICWRAPWMSTTTRETATWPRSEDCWTPKAMASACHWVSREWCMGEEFKVTKERRTGSLIKSENQIYITLWQFTGRVKALFDFNMLYGRLG